MKYFCPREQCRSFLVNIPRTQQVNGWIICTNSLHRIPEFFVLEWTLKIIYFQAPCCGQGHLPPDQIPQSPIQHGLENVQRGEVHNLFGQLVSMSHHLDSKEYLPNI